MPIFRHSDSSAPVPVRLEKKLPMPAVYSALGMAAAYYLYPLFASLPSGNYFILSILFLAAAALSFLRVLRYALEISPPELFPPETDTPEPRVPQAEVPRTNAARGLNRAAVYKAALALVAAAVGFSLGIAARRTVTGMELGFEPERITAVSGILTEDPRTLSGGSGLGIMELTLCAAEGGLRASARGNLTVFFPSESIPRLREFGRGCEIYADGTLTGGSLTGGIFTAGAFASGAFTGGNRRGFVFRASSVHVVKPAPSLQQFRTDLRVKLLERFQSRHLESRRSGEPVVWGGLASALLLGVRDDLAADLSDGFRNSGCSHVLALSGMHLAVLSGALAFLLKRPLGVRLSSLVGAVFIVFYVFAAGSQPSLVRAAIMYLIGTFALWGLLKKSALSLLCMAFVIQLVTMSDTGLSYSFILSYLSLAGILTLGESIRGLLRGRMPDVLSASLSASLGAFIVTSPAIALFFGPLRPIGILAGLVIAPFSSLFMILALAALAASFLPFPLFDFLDVILSLCYRFLEFIVTLAARVPGFPVSQPAVVLAASIFVSLFVLFIGKKDRVHRNSVASFD